MERERGERKIGFFIKISFIRVRITSSQRHLKTNLYDVCISYFFKVFRIRSYMVRIIPISISLSHTIKISTVYSGTTAAGNFAPSTIFLNCVNCTCNASEILQDSK